MFLGYQINDGVEFIASVADTREELENNIFVKYIRIEETKEDYRLINGEYRIGGLTTAEQNENIRQTRESLYIQTSDVIRNDYLEAVARGSSNAEQLKQEWLASKDKIREENPYVGEEGGVKDGLQN